MQPLPRSPQAEIALLIQIIVLMVVFVATIYYGRVLHLRKKARVLIYAIVFRMVFVAFNEACQRWEMCVGDTNVFRVWSYATTIAFVLAWVAFLRLLAIDPKYKNCDESEGEQ